MKRTRWRGVALAALFAWMCGGPRLSTAAAAPDRATMQARALFEKAEVHFSLREFEPALALYADAYKLKPLPGFLFNIGQCQRLLGRRDEALFSYRMYLQRLPEAPNRAEVEEFIRQLENAQSATEGSVRTQTDPPPPEPPPAIGDDTAARATTIATEVPRESAPRPVLLWSGAAASAVLVGTGVITGQMAANRSETYRDPDTTIDRRRTLKSSGETLATVSVVTLIAGVAVALGTGAYAVWGDGDVAGAPQVTMHPTPGGGTIAVGGRF